MKRIIKNGKCLGIYGSEVCDKEGNDDSPRSHKTAKSVAIAPAITASSLSHDTAGTVGNAALILDPVRLDCAELPQSSIFRKYVCVVVDGAQEESEPP